jgi:F-box/leucine-rich repeat protein 2/20
MTDKDIGHVSKCKKLRELDLMWLSQVTSKGLQKLGRLRLLQSLNLTNCKSLTDETLQTILPNLKFLKALSLAHCTLVGDPGLLAIASSSLQLRYLILFQLPLLTNEGITSLVTLNDLELLEISGCHHIDVPYCQALLKEFLPGLHLNHSAQSRESSSSSAHCVIS